ncbi:MAG: tetratricopeptide repeat protein, partial [Bryobacteraceae bacterium]
MATSLALAYQAGSGQQCDELVSNAMKQVQKSHLQEAAWAGAHRDLGRALWACGRLEEAESAYRRSLDLSHHESKESNPGLAATAMELAVLYLDSGRAGAAAEVLRRAGAAIETGEAPAGLRADWEYLSGVAAFEKGSLEEAERRLLAAQRGWEAENPRRPDRLVHLHSALARLRDAAGNHRRVQRHLIEALTLAGTLEPDTSEADARAVIHLASLIGLLGDPQLEEPLLRKAARAAAQYPSVPPAVRAFLTECHAGALRRLGRKQEAKAARAEARRLR